MGLAIAKRFAREGYDIALLGRNEESLSLLQQEVTAMGVKAKAYSLDLCELTGIRSVFDEIRREFGSVRVLVYNGGSWHETPAMEMDLDVFSTDLMLCITGALACAQAVYPDMKRECRGTILFTGGGLALYPQYGAGVSSLAAGKAGLRAFAYALSKELAPENIHVGTVTIAGTVRPDTELDPNLIADAYWALHTQPASDWSVETVFDGKPATPAL